MTLIYITAFYVISVVLSWAAIRKMNIVKGSRPDNMEVFFILCPLLNIIVLMAALSEIIDYSNNRSIAEVFFMMKK